MSDVCASVAFNGFPAASSSFGAAPSAWAAKWVHVVLGWSPLGAASPSLGYRGGKRVSGGAAVRIEPSELLPMSMLVIKRAALAGVQHAARCRCSMCLKRHLAPIGILIQPVQNSPLTLHLCGNTINYTQGRAASAPTASVLLVTT